MTEYIEKSYGDDFSSRGGALTLNSEDVGDGLHAVANDGNSYERANDSGWTISGKVSEDYYSWVNAFHASHPVFGVVFGDFEDVVKASSEEAFRDFWEHHEPLAWDYGDI